MENNLFLVMRLINDGSKFLLNRYDYYNDNFFKKLNLNPKIAVNITTCIFISTKHI